MAQRVETTPRNSLTGPPHGASVTLTVPADKDYVVIIRSSVAQLAACSGFTVREITDLRLAVNEACALLVAGGAGPVGALECRARVLGEVLRVTVSAPAGAFSPDTDGLGWSLVTALVDRLAWAQEGVTARIDLEKRRTVRLA